VLLDQLADIRAALFDFMMPDELAENFLHGRLFKFKPAEFAVPVAPTREFWMHVLTTKIEATIRNPGDMIGLEDDEETVGPVASAAKQSLLRALPSILPPEDAEGRLYRHVLEHGDYGTHNISTSIFPDGSPLVTSLFDWETACIVPALLADPLVAVSPVDLAADEDGKPSVIRIPKNTTQLDRDLYSTWSRRYIEVCASGPWYWAYINREMTDSIKRLYQKSPDLEEGIKAGKLLRHLWFALRDWRGGDSEFFFGELGKWADSILSSQASKDR